jgi:endogenous inhibitor of DNA gyrase (YacG/DUF329 family)
MAASEPEEPPRGKCSICGRPTVPDYRPFCSRRCADVDLSRWLRGAYAIPDQVESEDGETADPDGQTEGDKGER